MMDDGEATGSKPTLDARVAAVQSDIAHLSQRVDGVEGSVVQTRVELKADLHRVEDGLKADLHRVEEGLKADLHRVEEGLKADLHRVEEGLKEMFRDLKDDNIEVRSAMRTELGHNRRVLYALCGTAIVTMVGLLAKGVLY